MAVAGEGTRSRNKGLKGEREVKAAFQAAGWEARGLEASGDWLAFKPPYYHDLSDTYGADNKGHTLHVEVKRQERLRLTEWLEQAAAEAPAGIPPVVVFRRNRGEWYACLPLSDLLELTS